MKRKYNGILGVWLAGAGILAAQDHAFLRKDILAGHQPSLGVIGDFNGDGRTDVALNGTTGVSVALGRAGGSFSRPVTIPPAHTFGQVAADFNGDGKLDLAGSHLQASPPQPGGNLAHLMLGRGDGTFEPFRVIGPKEGNNCVDSTGDFNADGNPDLVVTTCSGPGIAVWLGTGDGEFTRAWTYTATPQPDEALSVNHSRGVDLNADGRLDLTAIRYSDLTQQSTILVFLGRGDGSFQAPREAGDAGDYGRVVTGDFNSDGRLDLATGLGVRLGNGDGTFQALMPFTIRQEGYLSIWAAADFNADGRIDLAGGFTPSRLPAWQQRVIVVLPGRGNGTFLPPVEHVVLQNPQAAGVADMDRDQRPDLVIASPLYNRVTVLYSRPQGGPLLRRAVSAASGAAAVAPGSLASLYGPALAAATHGAGPPWPTRLGDIRLEIRDSAGVARFAGLLYVSPDQINFQVPDDTALGEATLRIVRNSGSVVVGTMLVEAVAPGLFLVPTSLPPTRPASVTVRVEPDGSQTVVPSFECYEGPHGVDCIRVGGPAPGEQSVYVSLFGTGFRNAASLEVTGLEDGEPVPILYAGPQATPGVDQINLRLTDELRGGTGLLISINGVPANPVWLW